MQKSFNIKYSIWKMTLTTIHQLSCFVGHPVIYNFRCVHVVKTCVMLVQDWMYQEYYFFSLSFSLFAGPYSVLHDNKWRINSQSSVYRPIGCYSWPAQCIPDQAATVDQPSVYQTRQLQLTGPVYTEPSSYSWPAQCIPNQSA